MTVTNSFYDHCKLVAFYFIYSFQRREDIK